MFLAQQKSLLVDATKGGSDSWSGNSWGSNSISSWSISISLSLDGKMVSSGSGNSWFINWDNSTIGVSNELSVEVEGTRVAISWSISVARVGNSRSSSCSITIRNWSSSIRNWSSGIGQSWSSSNWSSCINSSIDETLGSQMVSSGSSNSGLINWNNSSIGEGLESKLSRCCGNTSGENQKLHF